MNVDSGSTAQYKYDHQNQRVTNVVGSSWTHYIREGGQVIGEHDATTAYTTSPPYQEKSARLDYVYARGKMIHTRSRATSTAPWTTRYYVSDVWSTRLVLDSSGAVLGRQAHLAFGEEFAESGTQEKHHFTSYEAESETATNYAVNRQYSQSVGRFGSADPYQANSYLVNPQSWNRYSYVENDPIHNVDPLGLVASYPGGMDSCCSTEHPEGCGDGESEPTEPKPKKCSINIKTSGRKDSTIDTRSDINPVNLDELGAYTTSVDGGRWFLIFEVQVSLGGEGWRFNQSVVRDTNLLLDLGGSFVPLTNHFEDLTDSNLAENPRYSQLVGNMYYWIDEPARRMVHAFGGGLPLASVIGGQIVWQFVMTATNSKDPRLSCSKRVRVTLTPGADKKWRIRIR